MGIPVLISIRFRAMGLPSLFKQFPGDSFGVLIRKQAPDRSQKVGVRLSGWLREAHTRFSPAYTHAGGSEMPMRRSG